MFERENEKYFMKGVARLRKVPPDNWGYRIFRIPIKPPKEETFEIREVFYDKGEIIGYDENTPNLSGLDLDELIMRIEAIEQATILDIINIDETNNMRKISRKALELEKLREQRENERNERVKRLNHE